MNSATQCKARWTPAAGKAGFTVLEMLLIIALLVLLTAFLFPISYRNKRPAQTIYCMNNLKQVNVAFVTWANDHGQERFPPEVGTNAGGSFEYIATGETFRHFQVLSNALPGPNALVCPADGRKPAKDLGPGLSNSSLSYFLAVNATSTNGNLFLSGDHNLTNGVLSPNRLLQLHANSTAGWTHKVHVLRGNIGLVDGSVQQLTTPRMRAQLKASAESVTLAMP